MMKEISKKLHTPGFKEIKSRLSYNRAWVFVCA